MIQVTKKKINELKEELETLTTKGRKELAQRLDEAKSFGDLKENAEYHQAREDQGKMESRIREITAILKEAVVIKHTKNGKISIGSKAEIENLKEKSKQIYEITSEIEADILENKISENSPIARAMLDKKIGEEFVFSKPNGDEVGYKIISIK